MSENLVKEHLEELEIISPDQFLDSIFFDGDEWEIYKTSDISLTYVRYELVGKIGYAFCVLLTCKQMTSSFESFYHVKSYTNSTKDVWDCDRRVRDRLMGNAISILKPY